MIEEGKLFCDRCERQIALEKSPTPILVELVREGSDRHYCESCFGEMYPKPEAAPQGHRRISFPRSNKKKSD